MKESFFHHKYFLTFSTVFVLAIVGSSCGFSLSTSTREPPIQTIQVTQLVTERVTQEITQEVTRVVEIPVTVTPSDTPMYTFTPSPIPTITGTPTIAPTSVPPTGTLLEYSDCLYGPGSVYLYKYSLNADSQVEMIGRNPDSSWLYIQALIGWNPCWIQATLVKFDAGEPHNLPVVASQLPYSNQYQPPDATAHRDGNKVTISWKAVWMSLDDFRGYLVEAWVCQAGTHVFLPITYEPPLSSNTGTLSIQVSDETDCNAPSSARIYSAEKHGYSTSGNIPWPVK
jgi:hypothetical protein